MSEKLNNKIVMLMRKNIIYISKYYTLKTCFLNLST